MENKAVYVIYNREARITKIGISGDLKRRIRNLEYSCGMKLELMYNTPPLENSSEIEHTAHDYFNKHNTIGEWFKIHPNEAIEYIKSLENKYKYNRMMTLYLYNALPVSEIVKELKVTRQYVYRIINDMNLIKPESRTNKPLRVADINGCKRVAKNTYMIKGKETKVKYVDGVFYLDV